LKEDFKRLRAILVSLLATVTVGAAAWSQISIGQTGAAGEPEGCPDQRAWTGKYHNYNYGFSITIPENLKGFWNGFRCVDAPDGCVCMQDHGRTIPLTAEPHEPSRLIEIYAGYASHLDDPTLAHVVSFELRSMRHEHPKTLEIRKRATVILAGLKGERVVVRYYDAKLKRWQREELVALVQGDVEYLLYLLTPDSSYVHDRKVFEAVVASFVLTDEEGKTESPVNGNSRMEIHGL
jgi:hypothetical protein